MLNSRSLAAIVRRDAIAWCAIGGLSLLTFLCLSVHGRFPGVDLPQHALILRRLLEGTNEYYVVDWSTPYSLFYGLSSLFVPFTDPVRATWLAMCTSVAILPIAAATLAVALGRSPALGAFALLAAFSSPVAWGFASLVLGTSLTAFSIAAAITYANDPCARRGIGLALLLALTYFAHSLTWLVATFTCWFVVVAWCRTVSPRLIWPLVGATAPSAMLLVTWSSRTNHPWLSRLFMRRPPDPEPTLADKLAQLPETAVALGRIDSLAAPWWALAVLFVCTVALGAFLAARDRPVEPDSTSASRPMSGPASVLDARAATPPLIWLTAMACYFVAPLWVGSVFHVYPRFLLLAGVLAPTAVSSASAMAVRALALLAVVPAVWLVTSAGVEVGSFARSRACIDELTHVLRADETLLSLPIEVIPPGYALPMDLHIHAEMVARRRGFVGMDFVDFGATPVVYRPGVDRPVAPPNVVWHIGPYDHVRQGGEFSAWILQGPPREVRRAVDHFFAAPEYRATTCGGFGLVQDMSVDPGALAHVLYLPHTEGHAADGCNLGDHHREKLPIGFGRPAKNASANPESADESPRG